MRGDLRIQHGLSELAGSSYGHVVAAYRRGRSIPAASEFLMEEIMTEVASRSMHYYLAKYGSGHFSPPPGPA